jgi:DNA-binding NarL/FixJ family response regulator
VIADDHVPTRAGVRVSLERGGFDVVAEAGSAEAAMEAARRTRPDACLLDIHMPGSGVHAAEVISRELPETVVLMLTVSVNEDDLFDALRAGAAGYLLKDMDPARLPDAVHGALRGEAPIPPRLAARLVEEFRERGRRRRLPIANTRGVDLTSREWEVVEFLREGLTTREIAERLAIADVTVRRHIGRVVAKLGVSSRREALDLFREQDQGA